MAFQLPSRRCSKTTFHSAHRRSHPLLVRFPLNITLNSVTSRGKVRPVGIRNGSCAASKMRDAISAWPTTFLMSRNAYTIAVPSARSKGKHTCASEAEAEAEAEADGSDSAPLALRCASERQNTKSRCSASTGNASRNRT